MLVILGTGFVLRQGQMRFSNASINDMPIAENERKFYWALGKRPNDHPGLNELGL